KAMRAVVSGTWEMRTRIFMDAARRLGRKLTLRGAKGGRLGLARMGGTAVRGTCVRFGLGVLSPHPNQKPTQKNENTLRFVHACGPACGPGRARASTQCLGF